jgi:hypothetical protein
MDKLVSHAIRMLEIVEGENDFFRNDAKRQADIARAVYDTILRVQVLERKADRKTEPTSCKTCRYGEVDEGYVRCAYYSKSAEQTEPQTETSTNAEKVQLKVQLKDEPQTNADQHVQHVGSVETMSCQECKHWIFTSQWGWFCPLKGQDECHYEPIEDEPQTDCGWK